MNFIMVTDTHLGLYHEDPIFLESCKKLHKEILEQDIDTIFHLGDFFHNRNSIGLKTMQTAKEIAEMIEESKKSYHIIIGNHDTHYKNSLYPNSLTPLLSKYSNIHIIDKPTIIENITLVPWNTDIDEIESNESLMGHFEINTFLMNDKIECRSSLTKDKFNRFPQVYSGHFHTPSEQDNIKYIGSAYQQTFADVDSKRGYYIFDGKDLNFVEFDCQRFIKIFTENIDYDSIEGNYVKLIFEKDYGNSGNADIIKEVEARSPLKLSIEFSRLSQTDVGREEDFTKIQDNRELLFEYVDKSGIPEHLNKNTLIKMINSLSEEIL